MDHRGGTQRDHRLEPAQIKQPGAAFAAGDLRHQAGKALKRPSVGLPMVTLFTTKRRDAEAKALINEAKTLLSLDAAEDAWHAAQPKAPDPVIIEHPPQPGDSELLGGGMSIHAPWKRD